MATNAQEHENGVAAQVLREYALLADGERGALIGPRGEIVWMCVPRWDSDAVFCALLGGAGHYAITPRNPWFVWGGHYEDGSLIWRSRWMQSSGAIECREALAFPGDPHTAVLLRRVQAQDRPAEVRVELDPRAGFGRKALRGIRLNDGIWTGQLGPLYLRWSGAEQARENHSRLMLELTVPPGSSHDLVLELSDQPLPDQLRSADKDWIATENQWKGAVPAMEAVIGHRDARHAYAVLAGLTSVHGGMVASATTSLPERGGTGRDYDYRFSWIRDQCYAGQAVAANGPHRLLDNAVDFVANRLLADGPSLRPAYTVDGATVPDQRDLPHLIGYPGGGAKVGNRVTNQFQLDAFGEALLLFSAAARHDHLDSRHWRAVETAVGAIEKRWGDAGAGLWEINDERWAHSRLICAAGLRSIAAVGASTPQAAAWESLADAIIADTATDCLHPSGRWQRSPSDERVDSSLLLPAIRGALPANDPRSLATLEAIRSELTEDEFVYRFRHDQRPLHAAEGAFLLCGFFMALAAQQQGDAVGARAWFERSRSACGPPGLYSEEYDVVQRQLRSNLPQAFVHALMLEAACRLARPWQDQ